MTIPTQGQLITNAALGGFTRADGKPIEWKQQKDGSYLDECTVPLAFDEKGKKEGEVKYTYSLTPKGEFLQVGVTKVRLLTKDQAEAEEAGMLPTSNTVAVPEKDVKKGGKGKGK